MAKVLIIDDDTDFCSMMEDLLANAGHEGVASTHPIIAAEDAMSGQYDVITLDVRMPDMDGAQISELFRDLQVKTPVIVISGHLTHDITNALQEAGITRIMQKPFRSAELLAAIEEATASPAS